MCEFELQKGSELALRTNKPLAHFPEKSTRHFFGQGID
jgi:hypothetical protein